MNERKEEMHETLFETIEHWKTIGEWERIKLWYTQTDTHERYYDIVRYIRQNRHKYGHRYREQILGSKDFIEKFGYLTSMNLDDALKCMNLHRDNLSRD